MRRNPFVTSEKKNASTGEVRRGAEKVGGSLRVLPEPSQRGGEALIVERVEKDTSNTKNLGVPEKKRIGNCILKGLFHRGRQKAVPFDAGCPFSKQIFLGSRVSYCIPKKNLRAGSPNSTLTVARREGDRNSNVKKNSGVVGKRIAPGGRGTGPANAKDGEKKSAPSIERARSEVFF